MCQFRRRLNVSSQNVGGCFLPVSNSSFSTDPRLWWQQSVKSEKLEFHWNAVHWGRPWREICAAGSRFHVMTPPAAPWRPRIQLIGPCCIKWCWMDATKIKNLEIHWNAVHWGRSWHEVCCAGSHILRHGSSLSTSETSNPTNLATDNLSEVVGCNKC